MSRKPFTSDIKYIIVISVFGIKDKRLIVMVLYGIVKVINRHHTKATKLIDRPLAAIGNFRTILEWKNHTVMKRRPKANSSATASQYLSAFYGFAKIKLSSMNITVLTQATHREEHFISPRLACMSCLSKTKSIAIGRFNECCHDINSSFLLGPYHSPNLLFFGQRTVV